LLHTIYESKNQNGQTTDAKRRGALSIRDNAGFTAGTQGNHAGGEQIRRQQDAMGAEKAGCGSAQGVKLNKLARRKLKK